MRFSSLFEPGQLTPSGAREEDINLALLALNRIVEAIDVDKGSGITRYASNLPSDELYGFIELFLAAACNKDIPPSSTKSLAVAKARQEMAAMMTAVFSSGFQ